VTRVRLLSANPAKEVALAALGVDIVSRQPLVVATRPENERYLRTKRERMGHDRVPAGEWEQLLRGAVPAHGVLAERYGGLVLPGAVVVAQLGQSLDGFIASRTGDAVFVTGEEDREHLHRLRALVDAVVVGATTVAADDSRLTVRAVPGSHPVRVVVDPRGILPRTAAVLKDGAAPTIWVVGPDATVPDAVAPHVEVVRWADAGPMDPHALLSELAERGLQRVLVEGGGRLVSSFVQAGAVDRLFLTTAPLLIGDGVPGLRVTGTDRLADAMRPPVRRWMLGDDVVTEFDLTIPAGTAQPLATGAKQETGQPGRLNGASRSAPLAALRPVSATGH
jgi:3,4-dihydroxy 2-butanone 4-phosphate synthase/GTP cyclohydrolase II